MTPRLFAIPAIALLAAACGGPGPVRTVGLTPSSSTSVSGGAGGPARPAAAPAGEVVRRVAALQAYEAQAAGLATRKAGPDVQAFAVGVLRDEAYASQGLAGAVANAVEHLPPPAPTMSRSDQVMLTRLQTLSGGAFDRAYLDQQTQVLGQGLALLGPYAAAGDVTPLRVFAGEEAPVEREQLTQARALRAAARG
jgi:putative membrane protein